MREIGQIAFVVLTAVFFVGCSSSEVKPPKQKLVLRKDIHTKPYELKITPIVGTRQDDEKVVMDMGKVMKIWIAPYKNNGVLVSSHDNFVVAKKPEFVIGEKVPQKNWSSMHTPINRIPFVFRNADLDKATKLGKEEIVKYNNNIYKEENNPKIAEQRVEKSNKYDKQIIDFLKK